MIEIDDKFIHEVISRIVSEFTCEDVGIHLYYDGLRKSIEDDAEAPASYEEFTDDWQGLAFEETDYRVYMLDEEFKEEDLDWDIEDYEVDERQHHWTIKAFFNLYKHDRKRFDQIIREALQEYNADLDIEMKSAYERYLEDFGTIKSYDGEKRDHLDEMYTLELQSLWDVCDLDFVFPEERTA